MCLPLSAVWLCIKLSSVNMVLMRLLQKGAKDVTVELTRSLSSCQWAGLLPWPFPLHLAGLWQISNNKNTFINNSQISHITNKSGETNFQFLKLNIYIELWREKK